ncbi:MAG: apolipoprotein N-acyltransferase [Candidatus Adiutrix sp.]
MPEASYSGERGLSFKKRHLSFAPSLLLAILGGLIHAASWSHPYLWPLCLVALVPLIMAAMGQTGRRGFFLGWVYGLTLFLFVMPVLADVLAEYGGLGLTLGWLVFLLLAAFLALFQALFAWFITVHLKKPFLWAFCGAVLWCGLDWLKNWVLTGFNWAPLAGPLSLSPLLGQSADIVGFYGLGFFVALANFFGVLIILRRRASFIPLAVPVSGFLLILGGGAIYGALQYDRWQSLTASASTAKVVVVQPSQAQELKWDKGERDRILSAYLALNKRADAQNPWLIIWPETAMPFIFNHDTYETEWLNNLSVNTNANLLVGVTGTTGHWPEQKLHNRMMLMGHGEGQSFYDKKHLVPFGEYLPLGGISWLESAFFKGLLGAAGIYSPGGEHPQVEIALGDNSETINLGILICFESTFPYLGRQKVLEGADFLVVPTNDGWFKQSRAPMQHLWHSLMRAVETRRVVVRVGNTGISALIWPTGQITAQSKLDEVGVFTFEVPMVKKPKRETFFVRHGYLFAPIMAAFSLPLLVLRFFLKN